MTTVDTPLTALQTLRRGLSLSPELRTGVAGIVGLSLVAMVGRVAIPVAIQQIVDHGLRVPDGPRIGFVIAVVLGVLGVLGITSVCTYLMMRRLFTVSETALGALRSRTFRHIHDLSMLH